MKKILIVIIIVLALIGVADASYLTAEHYKDSPVTCSIGGLEFGDCNSVLDSEYAEVFGIPVSLGGAAYYFLVLILSAFVLTMDSKKIVQGISVLTGIGLLFSAFLVYLMLFVLESICIYCMLSALTTTLLFIVSLFLLKQFKVKPEIAQDKEMSPAPNLTDSE